MLSPNKWQHLNMLKRLRRGSTKEKILLLMLGGLALGLQRSPKGYYKVLNTIADDWKKINQKQLLSDIRALYKSKLVDQKTNRDGTVTFILNKDGERTALRFDLDNMVIRRHEWDGKWRIVIFDIPERIKKVREAIRYHLNQLGFIDLQHSVFVIPFKCEDEIEYLTEFYNVRRFIRFIEAQKIDNELDLKHRFHLK
ncbi:MAG: hypothetical protein A2832_00300 [Candidatus Zambryskibacteria bacterium RIFCSPHIGHO2_01_FULL_44_22b]|uniref:Transcriptional repressor PaaX-like central Cas2-like domain-containing protein n=2 Tax=Candidatus Zambryskiibacteriota TaxID=1817925 RepID=A0A1G2T2C8_9BACT|nr:MAG: hypothetical protein A2832_00300 [Candidatus Zambryskibacteria bacterium RIFCSPHIGHO2_01_FULL_44_22b]OHB06265.1 MAG: hypothetical protein A3B16_00780 [Candidatus Zambryskibacteria bacterium RIFCSPLOWO2_01_FULL_45_43]